MTAPPVWICAGRSLFAHNARRRSQESQRREFREFVARHPEGAAKDAIMKACNLSEAMYRQCAARTRLVRYDRQQALWFPDPERI